MKKFLALFLALLMCVGVFAACAPKTDAGSVTLEQAKDYLYNVMKDKNGKALPNDYDVVGKIIIEGTEFTVTWATDNEDIKIKESSKANMWTVDLPDYNEEEFEYTLTATIKAADDSTISVSFTPKLPVIDNRGVSTDLEEGVAYKIYFEQVNLGYTLYALNTTQDGKNKFIEATLDPKEAADFYVEIVDGGYKVYTEIDGVKNYLHATATPKTDGGTGFTKAIGFATESDCVFFYDSEKLTYMVTIAGQTFGVGTYNAFETISISENTYFKNDNINVAGGQFPIGFMEAEYAETVAPDEKPEVKDPAADSTLTIAEAIALGKTKVKDQYTEGKYYVTGTITQVQNDTYGNLVISDGTNTILVYGTFDATGAKKYGEMDVKPVVGDTITVYGIVGMYNDAQIKNAWITKIVNGEGGEVTPPAGGDDEGGNTYAVVDTPVAGTAYKFGMVQQNAGKTVYLVGGMDGFYMATTEDGDAGIDVYLEATTGGYYLYTMVEGTKTYINMVVSGTHVNGAYEATASTVYTYDAENKTLIASVTVSDAAADYWFGTRNDKTYTTVGPCAVSYAGFFCQFYAVSEGGEVTPPAGGGDEGGDVTPPAGGDDEGGNTYAVVDTPVAGTAYKFGMVQQNAGKTVYLVGGMDGFYMATTEDGDAGIDVYLEATTGGYYLYTMVEGTKTYINMVVSGTHVNGAYEATASTVYTYDAENKTLIASVTVSDAAADYWFGTRNDKTYTTVGPCAVSYAGFFCQFYAVADAEGGDEGGEVTPPAGGEDDGGDDEGDTTTVTTIPGALTAPAGTAVVLSGTVVEIYQAWNDQYNNISVYIADENGNRILCFRLGTLVNIGDAITVTGTTTLYNETVQIAQGCTAVIDAPHVCSDFTEATCKAPKTCTVCGKETGDIGTHNYVSGVCSVCGHEEGAVEADTTTASKSVADLITEYGWTSSTTKQSFELDDKVTVKINGGNNTGKAYGGDHIRVYATDTPAGTITISVASGYELVGVKISTQTGTYAYLCLGEGTEDISNVYTAVSGSSVVLNSVKNGSDGKQVRVTAIEVEYKAV